MFFSLFAPIAFCALAAASLFTGNDANFRVFILIANLWVMTNEVKRCINKNKTVVNVDRRYDTITGDNNGSIV